MSRLTVQIHTLFHGDNLDWYHCAACRPFRPVTNWSGCSSSSVTPRGAHCLQFASYASPTPVIGIPGAHPVRDTRVLSLPRGLSAARGIYLHDLNYRYLIFYCPEISKSLLILWQDPYVMPDYSLFPEHTVTAVASGELLVSYYAPLRSTFT